MTRLKILLVAGAGAVILGAIEAASGIAFVTLGLYDPSASTTHPALLRYLIHRTMIQSVRRLASRSPASKLSGHESAAGLCIYRVHCAECHGAPAVARAPWANGLYPTPPYLIDAHIRWSPSQLHWIISNGIKMTAMPAWKASMDDQDIRRVVQFLRTMPRMSPAQYANAASHCP